jgi:hypothetical protein
MISVNTLLTVVVPATVSVLYTSTAIYYAMKKDWAWMLVWGSYAMANVGLIMASLRDA